MLPQSLAADWTEGGGGGEHWTPEPSPTKQRAQAHSVWSETVVNMWCMFADSSYEGLRTHKCPGPPWVAYISNHCDCGWEIWANKSCTLIKALSLQQMYSVVCYFKTHSFPLILILTTISSIISIVLVSIAVKYHPSHTSFLPLLSLVYPLISSVLNNVAFLVGKCLMAEMKMSIRCLIIFPLSPGYSFFFHFMCHSASLYLRWLIFVLSLLRSFLSARLGSVFASDGWS